MKNLSNELLMKAYIEAKKLKLDEDFLMLLKDEIERRNIEVDH